MPSANIVRRLIAFLKKPEPYEGEDRGGVQRSGDDYEAQTVRDGLAEAEHDVDSSLPYQPPAAWSFGGGTRPTPGYGSRLDALLMRAIQQFHAEQGYIIRREADGRMRYCTGRDLNGQYVPHTHVAADRRAVLQAVSSQESQLFVRTLDDNTPLAILCGPLWAGDDVIGVLYLNNPARSRLYRGVFEVFCDQAGRMLHEGVA